MGKPKLVRSCRPTTNRLQICGDFALHEGFLPDTREHQHGAVALIVSEASPFRIRLPGPDKHSVIVAESRSALINAGVRHALITAGEPVKTLYIEAHTPLSRYLREQLLGDKELCTDVFAEFSLTQANRNLESMDLLSLFPRFRAAKIATLEPRIRAVVQHLTGVASLEAIDPEYGESSAKSIAAAIGLSPVRFSHLFREQLGVSFRHYRTWQQLAGFMRSLPAAGRLTDHALDSGFWDSAHLSNTFRQQLGLSPSEIIRPLRAID